MLLVTCFTFFGLSAIQNLSYFSKLFDGDKISLNINAEEEENKGSNEKEVTEVKENLHRSSKISKSAYEGKIKVCASRHRNSSFSASFIEVITPPPEA